MRFSRIIAVALVAFALFVQSSAYAFAQPAPTKPIVSHCEEMQAEASAPDSDESDQGCCQDMQLTCLVSMNCLVPLMPGGDAPSLTRPTLAVLVYNTGAPTEHISPTGGPEPPPPQIA
jgi:hypothetical protein